MYAIYLFYIIFAACVCVRACENDIRTILIHHFHPSFSTHALSLSLTLASLFFSASITILKMIKL